MSSLLLVREAIRDALEGDDDHARLSNRVYLGSVEEGATEPYTLIDSGTEVAGHVHSGDGWEDTVTIHDFVLARDQTRMKELLARKDAVLHRQTLTITGFGLTKLVREFLDVMDDPDEGSLMKHMITRWRVHSLAN